MWSHLTICYEKSIYFYAHTLIDIFQISIQTPILLLFFSIYFITFSINRNFHSSLVRNALSMSLSYATNYRRELIFDWLKRPLCPIPLTVDLKKIRIMCMFITKSLFKNNFGLFPNLIRVLSSLCNSIWLWHISDFTLEFSIFEVDPHFKYTKGKLST